MMSVKFYILFISLLSQQIYLVENVCNFENCHEIKPDMLNVHILSHTHDDIGWLKTIDEYYYGDKTMIQRAGVQYILDSVIPELLRNEDRRFIYVEIGFFWRWWQEQDAETKKVVQSLVKSGRLEFINGGWCMNDEAGTHYSSIIDQMTVGFKFIKDVFGSCARPRAAWQIDPFGHSREQASLFAQMGMDGMFLGRIDWQDKNYRIKTKTMETVWQASSSLGQNAQLFTSVMPNSYSPPPGFCFDLLCNDEPIMDNPNLEGYNVDRRVDEFISYVTSIADWYDTNNIVTTMGMDFHYQQAGSWFKNLDKLIRHVNARQYNGTKINVFYSTPSCYLKAVHSSKQVFKTKFDDFFPYASDPHSYWSGYFTSRPTLKFLDRFANTILQATKQMSVLSELREDDTKVDILRRAMGNMQHHDAVTGTSKQAVANDYVKLIYEGLEQSSKVVSHALTVLSNQLIDSQFCLLLNISSCALIETAEAFNLMLYNPFAHQVVHNVRLPVFINSSIFPEFLIKSVDGFIDVYEVNAISLGVVNIPGRVTNARHELVFSSSLPAFGVKSFHIKRSRTTRLHLPKVPKKLIPQERFLVFGFDTKIKLDTETGLITGVVRGDLGVSLTQYFAWYIGMKGDNFGSSHRASGAYIFRPDGDQPMALNTAVIESIKEGQLVVEVHQKFNEWVSQVIRVYKNKPYVEFDWVVGPIPVSDFKGKEVVFRVDSDLQSGDTFYTDSNGREIIERKRNVCAAPNCIIKEPISSNYYPVNAKIFIKDKTKKVALTVFTDRSQGGTSLAPGQVDLMVHRRLLYDDDFGVGEALNEMAFGKGLVVKGTHQLLISPLQEHNKEHRTIAMENYLTPVPVVSINNQQTIFQYEGISSKHLPSNVNVLTLEFYGKFILLRLEHFYEAKDDPTSSRPAKVDLLALFPSIKLKSAYETVLGGNEMKNFVHRLTWRSEDSQSNQQDEGSDLVYTLMPMEIKSFIISTK